MPSSFRPQFLWLLKGPFVGALSGAAVAFAIVVSIVLAEGSGPSGPLELVEGIWTTLWVSVTYGGFFGAVVGFVAGLPFIVLVGRHLPRRVARRRAFVVGVLVSPVAMVLAFSVMFGELFIGLLVAWSAAPMFVGGSLLGGALAAWVAPARLPRPTA